ncbi:transposase [Anaerobacillus sp. HL2]|nr:transposase [Anaerobacillus sp. HL2]
MNIQSRKKETSHKKGNNKIYNESHQIYGAPKKASILQSRGHEITTKTVGNYMREEGIKAIWVRPYVRTTTLILTSTISLKTS